MFDSPSSPGPSTTTSTKPGGTIMGEATSGPAYNAALPVPPVAAAPPPMFGSQGAGPGKRPQRKSPSSFIGGSMLTPSAANLGGNTLIGQ